MLVFIGNSFTAGAVFIGFNGRNLAESFLRFIGFFFYACIGKADS